jgi:hypothetical protein
MATFDGTAESEETTGTTSLRLDGQFLKHAIDLQNNSTKPLLQADMSRASQF